MTYPNIETDFKSLDDQNLILIVEEVEKLRLKLWSEVQNSLKYLLFCFILFFFSPIFQFILPVSVSGFVVLFLKVFAFTGFFSLINIQKIKNSYRYLYKELYLKSVLSKLFPNSAYNPVGGFSFEEVLQSKLFKLQRDKTIFKSEDQILFNLKKTAFSLTELQIQVLDSISQKYYRNIFSGIFGKTSLDFSANHGELRLVSIDYNEDFSDLEKVNLESPRFNEIYNIYSNDQVFARYILNTAVMDYILDLNSRFDSTIWLSTTNQNLFFGWQTKSNYFEPQLSASATDREQIIAFTLELELVLKIVYLLKFHQQGWIK